MKSIIQSALLAVVLATVAGARAADDLLIADFEGVDYGAWKATGEAFGSAPARGALAGQMQVEGFLGKGLVNTFRGGDDATGALSSPPFKIERRFLAFLIGGGHNEQKLALQLLVDGQVVRSATGPNDRSGGSEALAPDSWDVSELAGQTASIRIVDEAKGGWGHLTVDHLRQTDARPKGLQKNVEQSIPVTARY
ncbi:MAG: 2,6-beta-D-fructofuranosidase, partial [Verrucomicrobia bacterium]|nr:2,6-beta-D-fructofuranosidase [Verrucomicrobiota bacterium]